MKKKHLYTFLAGAGMLGVLGMSVASAQGMWGGGFLKNVSPEEIATQQTAMFEHQAQILGVSVDEVKNAWAAGKNMMQLAQEKGITAEQLQAKMKTERTTAMKSHLQTLVSQGVITQAQADTRLKFLESQEGKMGHKAMMKGGMHMGMGDVLF